MLLFPSVCGSDPGPEGFEFNRQMDPDADPQLVLKFDPVKHQISQNQASNTRVPAEFHFKQTILIEINS